VLIAAAVFGAGMNVLDLLLAAKIVPSKAEGRRLIEQGGLAINGEKVEDMGIVLTPQAFASAAGCLVKKGKRHYYRLRISG